MRILVTGAAGFIGSNMVDFLVECGHEVLAVDNFSTGKMDNLARFFKDTGNVTTADIRDIDVMRNIFSFFHPQAVLHLAAQSAITTAWQSPELDLSVNGEGTLHMIRLALSYDVEKFVFSSTSAVYGKGKKIPSKEIDKCEPDTPYGISKLAAEQYIRLFFPNHVILRYGNVYGPRQVPIGENQVIARAFRHLRHGDEFKIVGNGNQKRDFVYVKDICEANYLALTEKHTGTFNVSTGESHSVNEVISKIADVYECPNAFGWQHTNEQDARGDVFISAHKLKSKFGWSPATQLSAGIIETLESWK